MLLCPRRSYSNARLSRKLTISYFCSLHTPFLAHAPRHCRHTVESTSNILLGRSFNTIHNGAAPISPSGQKIQPTTEPPRESRKDADAWLCLLDPFLPPGLDSAIEVEKHGPMTRVEGDNSIEPLLRIIQQARDQAGLDLLVHLGQKKDRWGSALWLTNVLVDYAASVSKLDARNTDISIFVSNLSLNQMTNLPIQIEHVPSCTPTPSLDTFSAATAAQMGPALHGVRSMGEVWQSLGSMITNAMNMPPKRVRPTMTYVLRVLAHVHHVNLIPSSIYSYSPNPDTASTYRPPILQLLSSRILSAMSDAVWNAHAQADFTRGFQAPQYANLSNSIPGSRHKLKVRDLGLETWIEFILWGCVDMGYAKEGASILRTAKASDNWTHWRIVDWSTVIDNSVKSESGTPRVNMQRLRNRSHMVVSETEGYSFDRPFVEMGDCTISAEVVFALIDSLISSVRTVAGTRGNSLSYVLDTIKELKVMLETKGTIVRPGFWDRAIIRLIESSGVDPKADPSSFDKILSFVQFPPSLPSPASVSASGNNRQNHVLVVDSSARLGLFYHLLHSYSVQGNIRGALSAFDRCYSSTLHLITSLNRATFLGRATDYTDDTGFKKFKPISVEAPVNLNLHLPSSIVPSFIELLSSDQVLEFGSWLLHSKEIEGGPFIPPTCYSIPELVPSLLRFAMCSADHGLQQALMPILSEPWPDKNVVRAFLQFEISQGHWASAERLLEFLKNKLHVGWGLGDAMVLAGKILRLEKVIHDRKLGATNIAHAELSDLQSATTLLLQILRGYYTAPYDPSLRINLRPDDMINQLCRIFATIPGSLGAIAEEHRPNLVNEKLPFNHISPNTFNILLTAVVETRGALEGRRLWSHWCFEPQHRNTEKIQDGGIVLLRYSHEVSSFLHMPISRARAEEKEKYRGKLVLPNLFLFRTLVRATVLERRKGGHGELDDMMNWIVDMFHKWGFSESPELDRELDNYLTERRRVKKDRRVTDPYQKLYEQHT